MKRSASANWQGTGKEGKGTLSTQSNVLNNTQYSFGSRFENGTGTNPEELIAAAHAGCFSMKLSFNLSNAGFPPQSIDTICEVNFDTAKGEIIESKLRVSAKVPGISKDKFMELVDHAEKNCPISKLLRTEISTEATLEA